jgi:hypothetical protein
VKPNFIVYYGVLLFLALTLLLTGFFLGELKLEARADGYLVDKVQSQHFVINGLTQKYKTCMWELERKEDIYLRLDK